MAICSQEHLAESVLAWSLFVSVVGQQNDLVSLILRQQHNTVDTKNSPAKINREIFLINLIISDKQVIGN